jgi:N-acetyltransferase 10
LALFNKLIRKISKKLTDIQKEAIGADIPVAPPPQLKPSTESHVRDDDGVRGDGDGSSSGETSTKPWQPVVRSIEEELNEEGDEVTRALREKQRAMIESLDLSK